VVNVVLADIGGFKMMLAILNWLQADPHLCLLA